MFGDLVNRSALAAAERVRKNFGVRAGLVSYRTLAEGSADSETRGRALLEGMACAIEIGDEDAVGALVGLYGSVTTGALDALARGTVIGLEKRGFSLSARGLAALELERFPRARTSYLLARCLQRAGDTGSLAAFERASALAETEGDTVVGTASRAFRVVLLYGVGRTDEARALEKGLALREVPPELLLRIARYGLSSSSRFSRAGWIAELEHLVTSKESTPTTAASALRLVCAHSDRLGNALSEMEKDRALAVFSKLRDEALGRRLRARLAAWGPLSETAKAAESRASRPAAEILDLFVKAEVGPDDLAHARRALEITQGRFEPKVDLPKGSAPHLALSAAAALRDGDMPRSAGALEALAKEVPKAAPAKQRPAWEPAYVALFADDEGARNAGLAVIRALLRSGTSAPARGALSVARACRAAGDEKAAAALLAMATEARESGAKEAYFEATREMAWAAFGAGQRDDALQLLREAQRSSG